MRHIAFACLLMGLSFFATGAEAKRGVGIVSYGDEIFDLGPVEPSKPEMRVGRLCQHVALFWADIATWNCRIVVANADLTRYGEVPDGAKAVIETVYANAPSNRGWWNQYGAYVFVGLFLVVFLTKGAASVVAARPSSVSFEEADLPHAPAPPAGTPSRAEIAPRPIRTGFGRRGIA